MKPAPREIQSPQSDFVKQYLAPQRRRLGVALVEGERSVQAALAGAAWPAEALLVEAAFAPTPAAVPLIAAAQQRHIPVVVLQAKAFARLSDCQSPPPVGMLVRPPESTIIESSGPPPARLLVLDRLADPGNVGTLVRSAAAFGFAVAVTDGGVRLDNEKMLRATAGMAFQMGVLYRGGGAGELAGWLAASHTPVLVLDPHQGTPLERSNWGHGAAVALVLGEEAAGVDWSVWAAAGRVRIPMAAGVESLNVAVTGAIALYELSRGTAGER